MQKRQRNTLFLRLGGGLLLMLSAFITLWLNEGRVNLADVARRSQPLPAETTDASAEGQFASITGRLTAAESVGDDLFLRAGDYVRVERQVEMYAWTETEQSDEETTSYVYEQTWTSDVPASAGFANPEGHENPPLPFPGGVFLASQAAIGAYTFDPGQMTLPRNQRLPLSPALITEASYPIVEDFIFLGAGTLANPNIGDVRVSYWVVPANVVATAFARVQGNTLQPYYHNDKVSLYRVLLGDRVAALEMLQFEYRAALWGVRFAGFSLMWGGVALLFSPINLLLGWLPGLRGVGRWLTGLVSGVIAGILALATILIGYLAHNLLALIIFLLLIAAGVALWQRRSQTQVGAKLG